MKERSHYWVVMRAHEWSTLMASGFPVCGPSEGPHRFLPVFNTFRQAVKWNKSEKGIYRINVVKEP